MSLSLRDAVAALPVVEEDRTGYTRDKFKHWVDADKDGCNTRAEVLIAEAVDPPAVGASCKLSGGEWYSYYDDTYVAGSSGLDVDHVVPLAEAWDSGASQWTATQRQQYANDLDEPRALVAVSAKSNRSKADTDVREWLPTYEPARCRYIAEWTAIKLRWGLTVDAAEQEVLTGWAAGCPNTEVTVTLAP